MGDEPAQEGHVGRHAADLRLGERRGEPVEGLLPRGSVRDQLRDHRVVGRAELVALGHACVDAHAGREAQPLDAAGLRQEGPRILGIETHLDRVTARLVDAPVGDLSGCDAQLLADEVDARHGLRDGSST